VLSGCRKINKEGGNVGLLKWLRKLTKTQKHEPITLFASREKQFRQRSSAPLLSVV